MAEKEKMDSSAPYVLPSLPSFGESPAATLAKVNVATESYDVLKVAAVLFFITAAIVYMGLSGQFNEEVSDSRIPRVVQKSVSVAEPKVVIPPVVVPVAPKVTIVPSKLNTMWSSPSQVGDEDVPSTAFPQIPVGSEDDEDAQIASAYTYENLQESLLNGGSANAYNGVKASSAWSRLGNRDSSNIWDTGMAQVKNEILASGQSIEDFIDSAMVPIPEQMAEFWKESQFESGVADATRKASKTEVVPRHAKSEAASVALDAMQPIPPSGDHTETVLNEILAARKRAKTLGVSLPGHSDVQVSVLDSLLKNPSTSSTVKQLVQAVQSF